MPWVVKALRMYQSYYSFFKTFSDLIIKLYVSTRRSLFGATVVNCSTVENHPMNLEHMRIATKVKCASVYLIHVSWRPNPLNIFSTKWKIVMKHHNFIDNSNWKWKMMKMKNKRRDEKCHELVTRRVTAPKLSYF